MSGIGTRRELQVRDHFRAQGWVAFRAPASLGVADVFASRRDVAIDFGATFQHGIRAEVRLIEVKATARGPFHAFGPEDRRRLSEAAAQAGASAWLAWWPARKPLKLIPESDWPT